MATFITVGQGKVAELLEANRKQTAANRLGLERQAKRAAEEPPPRAPQVNPARRSTLVGEELAAFRRALGTQFGFIDVNGTNGGDVIDDYFTEAYRISPTQSLRRFKVVRVVIGQAYSVNGGCPGRNAAPAPFFQGREADLARFMAAGGVVWINNEFKDCGLDATTLNQYISAAFGSTIGFVDNIQSEGTRIPLGPFDEIIRNNLAFTAQSGLAPPYFYTAATCSITGGTPYYSSQYGVCCAFERIGRGFLVLSGDSNGTAQFPSFTEGTANFIDALKALR